MLASGADDSWIRLWDGRGGNLIRRLSVHEHLFYIPGNSHGVRMAETSRLRVLTKSLSGTLTVISS